MWKAFISFIILYIIRILFLFIFILRGIWTIIYSLNISYKRFIILLIELYLSLNLLSHVYLLFQPYFLGFIFQQMNVSYKNIFMFLMRLHVGSIILQMLFSTVICLTILSILSFNNQLMVIGLHYTSDLNSDTIGNWLFVLMVFSINISYLFGTFIKTYQHYICSYLYRDSVTGIYNRKMKFSHELIFYIYFYNYLVLYLSLYNVLLQVYFIGRYYYNNLFYILFIIYIIL